MYLSNLSSSEKQPMALEHGVTNGQVRKGFTLMELLIVMAIIATLLGLGVGAINRISTSKGVSTAVPLADSLFAQARLAAKSSGLSARVVIYADYSATNNEENRSRYLRMIGIETERFVRDSSGGLVLDSNGDPTTEWKLASRPTTLPSNTFYNANLSGKATAEGKVIFPGSVNPKDCYVYEFNTEGALIEYTSDGTGSAYDGRFVIQAGKLKPGQTTPSVDKNATRDIGGFKIWRSGRMAMFRSPNQIIKAADNPEF